MSEPPVSRVIKLQDGETVKFIDLYAGERLLYDASCKEYKDKDLRLVAATRISEAMGISGFGPKEVIAKFKNLRSSYCQELKKIAHTERSGTGTDDVYVPKVIWFENMNSFIRPFVQQRPTESNLVVQEGSKKEKNIPSHTKSPVITINNSQNEKINKEPTTKLKRKAEPETWSSKKKSNSQDPQLDDMFSAIEKLKEISNRAARIPKEDSYDYFGKYISSMLRTIGPPTAMRLQEKIIHLITQEMCPPTPSRRRMSATSMSSSGTPSYSVLSDCSD